jgi:hypothetical protein
LLIPIGQDYQQIGGPVIVFGGAVLPCEAIKID